MSWVKASGLATTEFATAGGDRFYLSKNLTARLNGAARVSLFVDVDARRVAFVPDPDGLLLSVVGAGVSISARAAIAQLELNRGDRLNYTGTEEVGGGRAIVVEVERA